MAKTNDQMQGQRQAKVYRIRPATEDDMDAIAAINRRAWSGGITTHELLEQRHGMLNGLPWTEHITNAVADNLAQPDVAAFVAEQEGCVVGYAAAQIKREEGGSDIGIVSYNAVDLDYQGQGIGTALIRRVIEYLKEHGARVLAVWTLEADEPACHIYEKLGFEELTRFVYYSRDSSGASLGLHSLVANGM